ncbi:MAG: fatty acid desaturase [Phormidesmis sp. CAN_BIN44]|nr:fatty acid desaturase [Phormidesmis sp. CAN_BIN44]
MLSIDTPPPDLKRLPDALNLTSYLAQELHSLAHHPHHRLLTFISLYGIAATAAFWLSTLITAPWQYAVCLPVYLLAAASLHGISLFTHEGVHGTLSHSPSWNRLLSILCALPVLQNYSAYQVLHLKHHQNLGAAGDPDHYRNYTSWGGLLWMMHWGRLIVGYPFYIAAIPILGLQQGNRSQRIWIVSELLILGLLMAAVGVFLPASVLMQIWLIPMLLINVMVNIRGMSQHTLLEHETDAIRGTRSILTNPLTRFFMCNENFHLEHHLYPGVPWYNLPRLHQAIQPALATHQAPFISSYLQFVQEFVLASFRRKTVGSITIGSPKLLPNLD